MASDADELVSKLLAEGELDSSGQFSVDAQAALDKLADFRLRDPSRFALSWVRAATLLGASRLDIEVDADDVWFRFDGAPPDARALAELWSAVLVAGEGSSLASLGLRELALGVNGALAWGAKQVEIFAGEHGLRCDGEHQLGPAERSPEAGEASVVLHAERPLAWELIGRHFKDRRGELPEELVLAEACAHAGLAVVLEGRRLNEPRPVEGAWAEVEIDAGELRGRLWLRPGEASRVRVLKAGVEVRSFDPGYGHGSVEAVIDDPRLPLDLSQEKPVEGPRWAALLEQLSRARWRAGFELAEREGLPRDDDGGMTEALRAQIFAASELDWLESPGARRFVAGLELPRAVCDPGGGRRPLSDEPAMSAVWPWARERSSLLHLRLSELLRAQRRFGVVFASPRAEPELSDHRAPGLAAHRELPVLRQGEGPLLRALGHVDVRTPEGAARYRRELARVARLSGEARLDPAWVELRRRGDGWSLRAIAARGLGEGWQGTVVVGREGHRLAEFALPSSWGPVWIEVEGPFDPDPEAVIGETLVEALLRALELYPDLLAELRDGPIGAQLRAWILDYMLAARGRWSLARLAELSRLPAKIVEACAERWTGGWGVPPGWAEASPTLREGRPMPDHPLAEIPCLDRGTGRFACLREAREHIARHGQLRYLDAPKEVGPKEASPVEVAAPAEVWRLPRRDRSVLVDLFGSAVARFDAKAFARGDRGPEVVVDELPGAALQRRFEGAAGVHGVLGLAADEVPENWPKPPRRGAQLWLLARGRALDWMELPLPVGPFFGIVEVPEARAAFDCDRALRDEAWRRAAARVEEVAAQLAHEQLAAWRADPQSAAAARERVEDWCFDLEHESRGPWAELAAGFRRWQAELAPEHPARVLPGLAQESPPS